jgi:ribosomal protein S18 acetylase RimI-like enzyme
MINMMKIREGEVADSVVLSELAMIVIRQMDIELMKKIGPDKLKKLFAEFYEQENNGLQTAVAELDGEVVGAIFGYANEREERVDEVFDFLLQRKFGIQQGFEDIEAQKDEWYLDTLAVFDWIRGNGIGTKLIQFLPVIAKKHGKKFIGLNVDDDNPKAKKLYESIGFKKTGKVILEKHQYTHMKWNFE